MTHLPDLQEEQHESFASEDSEVSVHPKENPSWISHILPRFSFPFPSVPALSSRIPFLSNNNHLNYDEDTAETDETNGESHHKFGHHFRLGAKHRRPPPPSRSASSNSNRLELARTTSSYPESLHIHGSPPNARLRALADSIPHPSMPKFHRPEDPFDCLSGQDVVLLGGYRGSILRDARTRKRLWVPLVRAGFNFRKVDLAIPLQEGADERTEDKVVADGMLTKMGPVDFSDKLVSKLRKLEKQGKCRLHIFGYDWRISPCLASRRLQHFLEMLPSNQSPDSPHSGALVIAHSMGGLIAHHALQMRPELFYATVYCGTPFNHCVNILGPFKRGDALLANREILSYSVNFSMRSSFVFLPESGECFYDRETGESYPVNFFDHNSWIEYGLSPCVSDVGEHNDHHNDRRRSSTEATLVQAKSNLHPHPGKIIEPHMNRLPPAGAKHCKLKHNREEAIQYLKRTLEETRKFKQELLFKEAVDGPGFPPLAVVYATNTPTVRGAHVGGREDIKAGNWWDFSYGPGDGVVLAKSAQLPPGFPAVARVKTTKGHIQIMTDLTAVGSALEAVVYAKQIREEDAAIEEAMSDV